MTIVITDIDGVLNPFGARYNSQLNFTWLEKNNTGVFLKPDMHKPWIEKIANHAKFVWGSNWGSGSNLLLELLEIEAKWDWVPLEIEPVENGTWKLPSIQEWVKINAPHEKIVWLDDELENDAFEWAKARGNTLAIAPDRYQGLTEEDFENIYKFVSTV